eukprot:CAMPEP_0197537250 /NCGR_PEP_ID=MMETSP1318-20131121/56281_1 /TAXON_ID=552666 /ORGANISM="Partenskyella glossopodia, Strain RCC365" /LENGTH=960 /DNA_ID=CAMNT_0043095375 /DNA_START=107 /DNA_END=2992 /DNA_ORIENTATION=+
MNFLRSSAVSGAKSAFSRTTRTVSANAGLHTAATAQVASNFGLNSQPKGLSQSTAKGFCPVEKKAVKSSHGRVRGVAARAFSSQAVAEKDTAAAPVEKFRKDYAHPPYWVKHVELDIQINDGKTTVVSKLTIERDASTAEGEPMTLDGEDLKLRSVKIDGQPFKDYEEGKNTLTIGGSEALPASFVLETEVDIVPEDNTQLSGLYKSGSTYCTQCEAEGFRRITYHLDRPDVMAKYRVRVEADKSWPVLLSNGNMIDSGDVAGSSRHFAVFEDPFPKPSYLFAVVVGNLGKISDTFTTMSGRKVELNVFSEPENVDALDHAMESLKKSMKWDEERFGREYDLDVYHIVAVNDFNMGAMENKGLNVFNTALTLAKPETATDGDYMRVEGVIGHEYFHNWSGNRVTCRDWFQLTLKEGLTVFRDQEFSADMWSHAVKRIEEVVGLRGRQFQEDAGPMAHPIRPESYIAMDNFYTATVYTKGAEVIRMYHTLLGEETFRKGMDLYFERHDGEAVTCDDFRQAMADASGRDLTQFERWYTQAGTPVLHAEGVYNPEKSTYTLTLKQSCPATPGQPEKLPFHMPVKLGLIGKEDGKEVLASTLVELTDETQTLEFQDIKQVPVLSILRGYSAPVRLELEQSDQDLAYLMAHDTDAFNQWDAGQRLMTRVILDTYESLKADGSPKPLPNQFVEAVRSVLSSKSSDLMLQAYMLNLPNLQTLSGTLDVIDPIKLHEARKYVQSSLAKTLEKEFRDKYAELSTGKEYELTSKAMGERTMRNLCLRYLIASGADDRESIADAHFKTANSMTDKIAALGELVSLPGEAREAALKTFYDDAKGDALVINKWFTQQALASSPDTLDQVKALTEHPEFTLKNPNRARSLVGAFGGNMPIFHSEDGKAYEFLADTIVKMDELNPQIAARLLGPFGLWKRYDNKRQGMMKAQIEKILKKDNLSPDTFEVATQYLK